MRGFMTLRPQTQCLALSWNLATTSSTSDYGDGSCEQMLGDLRAAERFGISSRVTSLSALLKRMPRTIEPARS